MISGGPVYLEAFENYKRKHIKESWSQPYENLQKIIVLMISKGPRSRFTSGALWKLD